MKINYSGEFYDAEMTDLLGKVFTDVESTETELKLKCSEGKFIFYHDQDCCESVTIDDIVGDLQDLLNSPILKAEESTETGTGNDDCDTFTWTFYKLATIKGYVDIRWFGISNGYYSESVSLKFIPTLH